MAFNDRLSYIQSNEDGHHNLTLDINPCKNLSDIFSSLEAVDSEHLKVFLRIRPLLPSEEEDLEEKILEIQDATHVLVTAPSSSHIFRSKPNGATKFTQRFTFTHIYGPNATQRQIFEDTTQRLVKELIDGQNCLLFSYGATNSGKTHTIQGLSSDPGVLPRSLESLFQSISNQQYKGNDLKPQHFCSVVRLSEKEILKEMEAKEALFRLATDPGSLLLSKSNSSLSSSISKKSDNDSQCNSTNDITKISDISLGESVVEGSSPSCIYAVFVSFAEIYNENIYDLLERPSLVKKGKRTPLVLGEDKDGAIYIKGLRELRVTSFEEALQVLEAGRQSLHFASTLLNHHSSRSHCIFTVKLIRLAHPEDPHVARVSMLSLCDLAGTERAGKTLNSQDRLKEANNINTSLLVLGRCIAALRQNQVMQKQQSCGPKRTIPIPYRDSKVTRLFQSFFMGRGSMAMIVNVGTSSKLFDETLKVLKFSALAQKVAIIQDKSHLESLEESRRNSQFVRLMRQSYNMTASSGRLSVPWANNTLSEVTFGGIEGSDTSRMVPVAEEEEDDDRMVELLDLIRKLKEKLIQESKEKHELEATLRKELCEDFGRKIVEIEDSWRNRVQEERSRAEEYMDWRVNHLLDSVKKGPGRKRMRPQNSDDEDEESVPSIYLVREELKVKELENEKNLLQEELTALKSSLKSSNQSLKTSQTEVSKLTFQLAQLTTSYDKISKEKSQLDAMKVTFHQASTKETAANLVIEEMKSRNDSLQHLIDEKDNEIKEIKAMLDEAAEEFIDKEQKIITLKGFLASEKDANTKQSLTISELETQLSEAELMVANQRRLLEEREHTAFELRQEVESRKVTPDQFIKESKMVEDNAKSLKNLKATLEEKENVIQELEMECCNLAEKISSLEDTEGEAKAAEADLRKRLDDERKEHLAKLEKIQESLKDHIEEKDLLQFKNAELELEVKSLNSLLNEAKLNSQDAESACKMELSNLQEANRKLEKKLQNLEEVISLKEFSESDLRKELHSTRECLDKQVMDKQELESKLEMATQSEDSLKKKILQKQEEMEQMMASSNQLQVALQQISSLEASKAEMERNLKEQEDELLKSTHAQERLKAISEELESKLEASLQMEKDLKSSHRMMEAKTKALSDVKDDLVSQNRLLESNLAKSEALLKEMEDFKLRCQKHEEEEIALRKSSEDKDSRIASLMTDLESLQIDKQAIESQKDDLASQVKDLSHKIDTVLKEKAQLGDLCKDKESQLASDYDELKQENEKLSQEMEVLANQLKALRSENLSYAQSNEELTCKVRKAESQGEDIATLKASLLDADEVKKNHEEAICKKEQEIATLEKLLEEEKKKNVQMLEYKEMLRESTVAEQTFQKERSDMLTKIANHDKMLAEKDQLALKLTEKVESMDRKNVELEEECATLKGKYECLEKEVAAVWSSRKEERSLLQSTLESHEASISMKDSEISALQQEIKRLLRSGTLSDASESGLSATDHIKKESVESERIASLQDKLQENELERSNLLLKISSLEDQLQGRERTLQESTLAANSSIPPLNANEEQQKTKELSDFSEIDTPAQSRQTRGRKILERLTQNSSIYPQTPGGESLTLALEGSDIESASSTSRTRTTRKTAKKQPKDGYIEDCFKAPRTRKKTVETELEADSEADVWEPSPVRKTRSTRKTKSRRDTKIENPHLENKENLLRPVQESNDAQEQTKTRPKGRRRPLYNADSAETFSCSPNLIQLEEPQPETPHSVVRRQLRRRK